MPRAPHPAPSPRTRVRRLPKRGVYDRGQVEAVLDAGLVAHLGFEHDGQPYVIPTLHARVTICVPLGANAAKVGSIRALGAEIVEHGRDFDEAREHCEALAAEHGLRYVHSGDEPDLISGVGTHTLEVLEREPEVDAIVLPIGGGSGAAGACVVAKALRHGCEVIGVQAEAAPAAYRSWRAHAVCEDGMATAAEGLATRLGFALPQAILWEHLDDFVLVSEDELLRAGRLMLEHTRNLVELAGAAPLAAALRLRERLAGRRVVLVCSGGNVTPEQLATILAAR